VYCFKYFSSGERQFGMLSRGELFFASADELNDGSECRPRYVLKGSAELWTRLADRILHDACHRWNAGIPATPFARFRTLARPLGEALRKRAGQRDLDFDMLWPLIREELPRLLDAVEPGDASGAFMRLAGRACDRARHLLSDKLYIASFSRNPRDPTMWGHYGGAERGFCVIFGVPELKLKVRSPFPAFHGSRPTKQDPEEEELGIYADAEVELQSVLYRSAPLRFNAFHRLIPSFRYSEEEDRYDLPLLLPGEAPARQEDRFGLVKATTWKYEQELRAFLPSWGELTPEARCVRYDWPHIAGIIFGPKMSVADKERAIVSCYLLQESRRQAEARTEPFVFLEARQRADSFQLALAEAGVLDGVYGPSLWPFESLKGSNAKPAAAARETCEKILGGRSARNEA
jgi:hypothetical protein